MNIVRKYQGNSWNPSVVITTSVGAKDCTGLDCVLIIKRDDILNATADLTIPIAWTNQAGGLGTFTLTPVQSLTLEAISYFYEVSLYSLTYQRTCNKGRLDIAPSLGIT